MKPRLRVLKIRAIRRRRKEKATLKKSRKCTWSVTFTLLRFLEMGLFFPGGWGDSHINVTTMLVFLAFGCKMQILVSPRLFGMESHYICPFRYRLVLFLKKFIKNALTLTTQKSPSGFSKWHKLLWCLRHICRRL